MWILFGVTVGMVHPVHDCVCPGYQVGRPLCKPCQEVKEFFAFCASGIHLMGSIPMQEKGMKEQRNKPVRHKENKNCYHCH